MELNDLIYYNGVEFVINIPNKNCSIIVKNGNKIYLRNNETESFISDLSIFSEEQFQSLYFALSGKKLEYVAPDIFESYKIAYIVDMNDAIKQELKRNKEQNKKNSEYSDEAVENFILSVAKLVYQKLKYKKFDVTQFCDFVLSFLTTDDIEQISNAYVKIWEISTSIKK